MYRGQGQKGRASPEGILEAEAAGDVKLKTADHRSKVMSRRNDSAVSGKTSI